MRKQTYPSLRHLRVGYSWKGRGWRRRIGRL